MVIKCVVPVSGGKDSQACLKLALEVFKPDEVRGLFCDTQFEHPLTYAHVDRMADMYGVVIHRVCDGDVLSKCERYGRFPGGGARHCTDELKIRPTKVYIRELAKKQGSGFEVWYGMRSAESNDRAKRYENKVCDELYAPHEVQPGKYPKYLQKMGVMFRLPILDWTTAEVKDFVGHQNLNPLYAADFDRVGCFPCMAAGDRHKERAFTFDEFGAQQYMKVQQTATKIGKPIWLSQEGVFRNEQQGCLFCAI